MSDDEIRKGRELCERATPGPYEWALNRSSQSLYLRTTHSGRLYVLGFARWGMRSAAALFRGAICLVRADELAKDIPGQEHNNSWNQTIDHPDANFMAYFDPARVALLLEEVELSREYATLCIDHSAFITSEQTRRNSRRRREIRARIAQLREGKP